MVTLLVVVLYSFNITIVLKVLRIVSSIDMTMFN